MNNQIIQASFHFKLLSSDFQSWTYKNVRKDDTLIVLKELDLTKAITRAALAAVAPAANTVNAAVRRRPPPPVGTTADARWLSDVEDYWKIYDQTRKEYQKTEKINGYKVLNIRLMDRLWISCSDMEILVKCEN